MDTTRHAVFPRSTRGCAARSNVAALALAACFLPTAVAAEGEPTEETAKGFQARSKVRFEGDLIATYTDNLFHYSDERLDDFDRLDGPGQRFENLEDPEDIVTRARLDVTFRRTFAKGRDFQIAVSGARYLHERNDIADYSEFEAGLRIDATRNDRLFLRAEYTPDRFKKNYLKERIGPTNVFAPATYDQVDAWIGYERKLTKAWNVGLALGLRERSFNEDFTDRDQDGRYLEGYTGIRLARGVWSRTTLGYGVIETDIGRDLGVDIDRSYDESLVEQEFEFESRRDLAFGVGLEYRRREYTTDERADTARFDRTDERWKASLKSEIPLGRVLSVLLKAAYTDNDSVRDEFGFEVDEGGYQEVEAGIGLRVSF